MRISKLAVMNYRGLRDVAIPMSRFGCLIGENNSGKSSFLQALSLFFSGSKLPTANFFKEDIPVRIALTFEDIGEGDLARLAEEHRTRVEQIVDDGCLTLVRSYPPDGKSALLYNCMMPTEERFSASSVTTLLKGGRPGQAFVTKVTNEFPELDGQLDSTMNQEAMRQRIQELADGLPDYQKQPADVSLPTGIDRSILPMLPEPIYIPAVKDLADDIKTSESTPFGKILSILLQAVESKLPDAQELFEQLNKKLNRTELPDGTEHDERLDEVKLIESTVEKYVQESFSSVSLKITIPPPELKTVFSSAQIFADDGVEGLIDTKGDGLRRAIVFSILRSYVELSGSLMAKNDVAEEEDADAADQQQPPGNEYLLLFEEPELFLHPKAQQILFDALRVFSQDHHVVVTTHSPMFFGAQATGTFIKLYKTTDAAVAPKPFAMAHPVDLSDLDAKDQFQIICFESNNAAFFADTVVLVEGDSDYLVCPHLARVLNPEWDLPGHPVHFARISGKGNIRRYREFFNRFNIRVAVIADLDILLDGFQHIQSDNESKAVRDKLLQEIDKLIEPQDDEPTAKEAKKAHASGDLRSLWKAVKEARTAHEEGKCSIEELNDTVDRFFAWQRRSDRLDVLANSDNEALLELKWQLFELLRQNDVFVLELGAIEAYYPNEVAGPDKPSRAQDFCAKVKTRDEILNCCKEQQFQRNGETYKDKEFNLIFTAIFGDTP